MRPLKKCFLVLLLVIWFLAQPDQQTSEWEEDQNHREGNKKKKIGKEIPSYSSPCSVNEKRLLAHSFFPRGNQVKMV